MQIYSKTMTKKDVERAVERLGSPCLVPLVKTVKGCQDPASIYFSLRSRKGSFLLESTEGPGEEARYSIIGSDPLLYLKIRGKKVSIAGREDFVKLAKKRARKGGDALDILRRAMLFDEMKIHSPAARYMLSCTGYIGYDYVRSLFNVGNHAKDDLGQPELEFILPERMMIFDHVAKRCHHCSIVFMSDGNARDAVERAASGVEELLRVKGTRPPGNHKKITARPNVSKAEFERMVERAKEYVHAGDIIQAVLSRRIELDPSPRLENFYVNLRKINPSPYMFFLDFPERSIVGSSPEILVRVEGSEVMTRPIAGTRRRGESSAEDRRLEKELLADEKERAEHVMLVDLGRNDIGRVSEFNSVKVDEFMSVEKYSHVQHIVTNVVGKLRNDRDAFEALRATFPAGTVAGAPKVRAMEIIEELEPTRRGVYAGALGSFSYTGDADLAITIRTLISENGKGYVQVGAGIVADSVLRNEYYETENKARALMRAAGVNK